jgi:hypothetical protein
VGVARAVAVGVTCGLGVAVVDAGDDENVATRPGTASQATQRTSSNAAKALIVLG